MITVVIEREREREREKESGRVGEHTHYTTA